MLNFKIIGEYIGWLIIALGLSLGVVAFETEFLLKEQNYIIGLFVGTFGSLKRMMITYLGGFIGLLSYLIFVPVSIFIIKKKIQESKKQILINFLALLILVVLIKISHSILAYTFNLI